MHRGGTDGLSPVTYMIRDLFFFFLSISPLQTFAESTMNELLGWYGYDKVELRDSEATEMRNYPNRERRQHVSVLKGESRYRYSRTGNIASRGRTEYRGNSITDRTGCPI